jgi:serine/threonine protein kinase
MEYVNGESLAKILTRKGRLDIQETVDCFLQVCGAIEYAHSRGLIHRDLKPANILIENGGRALVADFGISKLISSNALEETLTVVGTPLYMSPEQCGEGSLDLRTDIYSLGVILYEMLLGKPPFHGETAAEIIKSHLLDTPRFPREDNPLPAKAVKIIRKMLAKRPDDRYASAGEVVAELLSLRETCAPTPSTVDLQKPPTILCHVPQRIMLGAVVSAMKSAAFSFAVVSRVHELLERLNDHSIEAVILGAEPGDNAIYRLAQEIRRKSMNQELHIILVNSGISRDEVQKALRSGITDIVAEPFNPSILVSKIEGLISGGHKTVESRRFFRKSVSGTVRMRVDSEIMDISEDGMKIHTNMSLKTGEVVTFELDQFRMLGFGEKSGKVVWISANDKIDSFLYQAGINFLDVSYEERRRLRKWILEGSV